MSPVLTWLNYIIPVSTYIYCTVIKFGVALDFHLKPVILLQKKNIRINIGEGYLSHTCTLFFQARILKLNDIHEFIVCNHMFKNLEKFQESGGQYHYSTRNRNLLCPIFQILALTQHSIFISVPHFWNSLQINLRSIGKFHTFK